MHAGHMFWGGGELYYGIVKLINCVIYLRMGQCLKQANNNVRALPLDCTSFLFPAERFVIKSLVVLKQQNYRSTVLCLFVCLRYVCYR